MKRKACINLSKTHQDTWMYVVGPKKPVRHTCELLTGRAIVLFLF